ncbi:cation:proton antiporter [Microbacterium sediminicola]|uniref:Cation:proton antiporter n=1 Tax=Microbacterium sediminicola TaxID=415210 RepID=A0ABN2IK22_9MICO
MEPFFLVPLLAVIAPVAARLIGPWLRVPVLVFELLLGILVGPALLGWLHPEPILQVFSQLGLALLFFIAGSEIHVASFRGKTGRNAILGWVLSLALGIGVGALVGSLSGAIIIGIALSSTALGTLLPILRDAGENGTPFGRAVGALGAVGEFGPLVAISIFLAGHDPGVSTVILGGFLVLAAAWVLLTLKLPHGAMHAAVSATLHTSSQFAIRVVFAILGGLLALTSLFDVDFLLGAFAAGLIWQLMMRDASEESREAVESKVEGIAFGLFVPIFFLYTGITFDLTSLLDQPELLLFVPVVLVGMLVVRGLPSLLAAPPGSSVRDRFSLMLFGATGLPIVVAVTAIGVDQQLITSAQAAVLVAGGMLSVLIFPLVAMAIRGDRVNRGDGIVDEMA